jgi:ABC-type nickel/cobalt efflux system permease component RcnA
MTEFSSLLQQGHAWLFIPSAILLGALHGLEPGHSKTMMAAFIVAIHGTLTQAVLLGLSATLSHTAVVWVVAMAGLYFGRNWDAEATEPYFQVASAVLIVGVAAWMLWRTWRSRRMAHAHDHDYGQHPHHHAGDDEGLDLPDSDHQDPHALAHAEDIRRRFAGRAATTGQIVLFGLTCGLVPCPASITVLLLCLQLKKLALGAALVLCFSVGLALTLVASGALAALGVRHVAERWSGLGAFARNAPYFSGALIALVGLYVGYQGLLALK